MNEKLEVEAIPSPRATPFLVGHGTAASLFREAFAKGRLHHAWLLSGPKGIGKATLSYHLARFLLKAGEGGLFASGNPFEIPEKDPLFLRVASGAEGNLRVIERSVNDKTGVLRSEIIVEDIRALHDFFEMTASREGWRAAIIDSADEMNRNAANALLKMLEEPPSKSVLFLVSHAKGKLLPTIRSRCQQIALSPLSDGEVATVVKKLFPGMSEKEISELASLANGSPGFAIRLAAHDGLKLKTTVEGLLAGRPMAVSDMHTLATLLSAKANEEGYFLFIELLTRGIGAKVRTLSEKRAPKARLDCWLSLWDKVNRLVGEGEGLNLGRKQILLIILEDVVGAHAGTTAAA